MTCLGGCNPEGSNSNVVAGVGDSWRSRRCSWHYHATLYESEALAAVVLGLRGAAKSAAARAWFTGDFHDLPNMRRKPDSSRPVVAVRPLRLGTARRCEVVAGSDVLRRDDGALRADLRDRPMEVVIERTSALGEIRMHPCARDSWKTCGLRSRAYTGCRVYPVRSSGGKEMPETDHCEGCGAIFQVVSEVKDTVEYCPFCGDELAWEFDDEDVTPA